MNISVKVSKMTQNYRGWFRWFLRVILLNFLIAGTFITDVSETKSMWHHFWNALQAVELLQIVSGIYSLCFGRYYR